MPVVPRAIQSTFAVACHGQLAFTVNVPSPPPTAMFCVVGVMVKVQLARPSWVTVTCCSPMLMIPARASGAPVFVDAKDDPGVARRTRRSGVDVQPIRLYGDCCTV